jgi:carboxymethylenebutenolidase
MSSTCGIGRIFTVSEPVDYFFSATSPWSYLGHQRFAHIADACAAAINVKPVDYSRVFAASGGLPLKQRPAQRQAYRMAELRRFRAHLDVPLILEPRYFPTSADPAALAIIAVDAVHGAAAAMQVALACMRACWVEERDIGDAGTIAGILRETGHDAAGLDQPSARLKYDAYTQEAIALGVFGAPTYVVRGELFWGQDRLDFVERALWQDADKPQGSGHPRHEPD